MHGLRDLISLRDSSPLFTGTLRHVYQHPAEPGLLIKVPKYKREPTVWERRWRPYFGNTANLRELREVVRMSTGGREVPVHFPSVFGMVRTDKGWGLVVGKECDRSGAIAPTLGQLKAAGRFDEASAALERFVRWLQHTDAVVQDVHPNNLLLADRGGTSEIVLIDGFGDRAAITMRTYFPSLNRRRTRHFLERFERKWGGLPPRS
jgi:hypothetical protein